MPRRIPASHALILAFVFIVVLGIAERPVETQSAPGTWAATDLGTLGGPTSVARGTDNLAISITGTSVTPAGATHAFKRNLMTGFKDLGTLGGTNSEGLVVSPGGMYFGGRAQVSTGKYHAFLVAYGGYGLTDAGTLGGSESATYGVNDAGVAVGSSQTSGDAATQAFIYRGGAMTPLGVSFGGSNSAALAVNYAEHVTGYAGLSNGATHAFLYTGGATIDLLSPSGSSVGTAINETDDVAGYWMPNASSSQAFLYTSGVMQTLPGLGGAFAYAYAINKNRDVVGEADTSGGVRHAVLWQQGTITDLNTLLASGSGWVLQSARSIDDYGNIVGYGTHKGQTRGFLLSPPIDLDLSITNHANNLDTNIPNPHEAGTILTVGPTVTNNAPHWATGVVITDTISGPVEYVSSPGNLADCTQSGQSMTCRLKQALPPGSMGRDLFFGIRATGAGTITHSSTVSADESDPNTSNNSQAESNHAISLLTFTLNSPIVGGSPALGHTSLTGAAPGGGATVKLTSSNPALATVPLQFDVAAGDLARDFYVRTQAVTQDTTVQISATYGLVTIAKTLTILASQPSAPFGGSAWPVPGTIQAEDYDLGGEGVAYHDVDVANNGGTYRADRVDIERTTDTGGGYDVGWIAAGEWLKYTVNVAAAGSYTLQARVASPAAGGIFHVEANGVDKTGPLTVPATGGWQAWTTISKTVTLTSGQQVLRLVFDTPGSGGGAVGNVNYLRLSTAASGSTPFGGTPRALPGTVQAEDFDEGGEGVAYHDTTGGNSGGAYRATNVDIEGTTDSGGGYNVGWMAAGEWMNYTVNVASAGSYTLGLRVASNGAGGTLHVEANGVNVSGPLTIPNTGGWQNWTTVTAPVSLSSAGVQVMRLVLDANGPGGVFGNINSFSVAGASGSAAPEVVLYASALTRHGAWFGQSDPTAAGGFKVLTPDLGWSTTNVPLASPADYVEATFDAPAATPYAVWLRLRATSDTKYSESVWVQFSDARAAGGGIYGIGSTSALLVNLEDCSGCGVSGWGWQNGAYWLSQYSTVTFATSGRHTIRIQVREDGAQLDQVVLSPARYLLTAPGPVKNDTTIVQ